MISSPFRGEVVSLATKTLSVKQGDALTISFAVSTDVKVVRTGKVSTVQEIKKGDLVAVTFTSANAGLSVTQIEVTKPAAP